MMVDLRSNFWRTPPPCQYCRITKLITPTRTQVGQTRRWACQFNCSDPSCYRRTPAQPLSLASSTWVQINIYCRLLPLIESSFFWLRKFVNPQGLIPFVRENYCNCGSGGKFRANEFFKCAYNISKLRPHKHFFFLRTQMNVACGQ
jgi:hypothetical protein